ncbi:HAMP domain-containing protein [Paenibacillus algorifonticola]|uniref:histidine kinase n=1 Tax=Paenibacillus algorifonticola TaxID=684063 RepID=A0A1I2J2X5_9BACL|nr:HAMP domain-containing sensor histidine kinase [Paenibacillus algorifonticola]SFF48779.1 HAMP domain-containing protein [Paenibacillus algorifonticola]
MIEVIRNPEWKSIAVKALALQLLLSLFMFFFINSQVGSINQTIVDQNAALIGYVLKKQPQVENEIIHYITQGAEESEITEGKRILEQYGYKEDMSVEDQPALSGIALPMNTAALVLLFVIPFMLLLLWEYRKLFDKIKTVAVAAEQVVERQFDKPLPENEEGDFGSLGRSFNAMAGRLNNSLEQLKQEKTFLHNLLSDISHQLKTPLASLIVFNENLLNDPKMKEEMKVTFLERSRQQLERMEWLIVSLLKLARVEAGAILFHDEVIRMRELIENAVQSLRLLSVQKMQKIYIRGGDEILVQADEEWLTEAFINLIKNALEHTPKEGEIHIVLEVTPLFYTVIIRDHGEGISPEDLPHIFKRFYRGRSTAKPQSIGIGLSLTKLIIEEQGGIITVASKRGEGTEFRISFLKGSR